MLQMIRGCRVPDPSLLYEGYEVTDTGFAANVDAGRIQTLFEAFVRLHDEYCYVILEVPTNAKDEPNGLRRHRDVYYLDGLTPDRALDFLGVFGERIIHDGLSCFGIGIHSGNNEMMAGKYNVVTVYTKESEKYTGFFEEHGIGRVPRLITAWDTFTPENPGESFRYVQGGKHIFDLVEHLKQYGLYFAERREA